MKTFRWSLAVFLVLLCGIGINYVYVNRTTDELKLLTEKVPEDPSESGDALDALAGYWESNRDLLGLSVSSSELNRADDLIVSMRSHKEQAETADYLCDRALLLSLIGKIKRLERIHVWNIF